MRKQVIRFCGYLVAMLVLAPCFLTFTESEEGHPTIWNVIGIVYSIALCLTIAKILRK